MYPKTMKSLEEDFKRAEELNKKYMGVLIHMEGFPLDEVIINGAENFEKKLEYYKKTYNDDLTHKYAGGISISGFAFGDSFAEIESQLVMA